MNEQEHNNSNIEVTTHEERFTTYDGYAQTALPNQQTFPVAPFPRKYIHHSAIDNLHQAEQALQTLQDAGYNAQDIRLFASQEFVTAVEHGLQQQSRLSNLLCLMGRAPEHASQSKEESHAYSCGGRRASSFVFAASRALGRATYHRSRA